MNILIVKLSAIGDVIHTLPVIDPLRNHFQHCTITWAVEEKAADLLAGYPGVDSIIISKRKTWLHTLFGSQMRQTLREIACFVRELRLQYFDLIIDFQGLFKSGLVLSIARSKQKVGYEHAREGSHFFYNKKITSPDPDIHAIEKNLHLIRCLGIPSGSPSFHFRDSNQDSEAVQRLFCQAGIGSNGPIICVHPGGTWGTKRWQAQRVAELCDSLEQKFAAQVMLIGGSEEKDYAGHICSYLHGKTKNLSGKTTLRQLVSIFHKADLFITMDSGPMHLGSAVGIPVVALFGPTAPWRTGPYGKKNTVIRKTLPCSPCFRRKCPEGHHLCMGQITVEEVLEASGKYLHPFCA